MNSLKIQYKINTSDVDTNKRCRAFSFMSHAQEIAYMHATAIGFGYSELLKSNSVWVLSRMDVRFLKSPVWDDVVEMETWHKGRDGVFSLRDFEVRNAGTGELLIASTSSWLIMDIGTRRLLRPEHVLGDKGLSTALERDAVPEHCGKLRSPSGMELVREKEVLYSDLDFNMHVNNAKYIEWAFDSISPEILMHSSIDSYSINFNHEARLGEKVSLYHAETGEGRHFIEGKIADTTVFLTSINLKPL